MKRNQPTRAIILFIYIGILFLLNYLAFDDWLPEKDYKGLWFYAGIASILLGNLLVTPFYTKPVDAISYSVVSLIAIFLVNNWSNWNIPDKVVFITAISIQTIVIISAFICILTKDSVKPFGQKISKSGFIVSEFIGNQRVVFSVVILFALIVFHRTEIKEMFYITIAWIITVIIEPDRHLINIFNRIRGIWFTTDYKEQIGYVSAYQTPNMILIKQPEEAFTNFGTNIIYKDAHTAIKTGITLNYVGRDEQLLLRAIEYNLPEEIRNEVKEQLNLYGNNSVALFDYFDKNLDKKDKVPIVDRLDDIIGIVDENTNVEKLQFEIFKDDDIEIGCVVEVEINGKPVLYQILDGITYEDKVFQRNKYGYARAQATKIGIWDFNTKKFEPINWIPQINSPVFIKRTEEFIPDVTTIGHFPKTNFTVGIKNINHLVTHNTAILGILGIGKSMLSIEIVERLISEKIKVICIDLTNQYANLLKDFYDSEIEEKSLKELYELGSGGKSKVSKHVEEGGSINDIRDAILNDLETFIISENDKFIKIYNPSGFEVWRQDSKPFANEASMASLTPTEITQIISDCTLSICQNMGMTDNARVCLVYEEAHSLIPEWNSVACEGDKAATNGTARAILQGRKYGLGCILITQRTANVTKTILNQCNSIFAMRTFDDTGKNFIANYIGTDYADKLSTLQERQAVFYGKASSCENPVLIRLNDRDNFLKVFRAKFPPPVIKPTETKKTESKLEADDLPF
ncbi:MAG: DUF87 domain-containing protein [Bacteroidales bacterium]|nr:DUF87 domain-containing protein [Bacteroidales bacterium]